MSTKVLVVNSFFFLVLCFTFPIYSDRPVTEKVAFKTISSENQNKLDDYSDHAKNNKMKDGLAEVIISTAPEYIQDLVRVLRNKNISFQTQPTQILLDGRTGAGKTSMALAIAKISGRECTILHGLYGAQNIKNYFDEALQSDNPQVLVLEDIDHLAKCYNNERWRLNYSKDFWTILQKIESKKNILIVATTCDIKENSKLTKKIFYGNIVSLNMPDTDLKRVAILKFYLDSYKHVCDSEFLKKIVKDFRPFCPRSIEAIVNAAWFIAINRNLSEGTIRREDLAAAVKKIVADYDLFNPQPTLWQRFKNGMDRAEKPVTVMANLVKIFEGSKDIYKSLKK